MVASISDERSKNACPIVFVPKVGRRAEKPALYLPSVDSLQLRIGYADGDYAVGFMRKQTSDDII